MFGFFTIMFMLWAIILLMKDNFVHRHVRMAELHVEKLTSTHLRNTAINLELVKLSSVFFFIVFVHFVFFLYLGYATKYDHFIYPTFVMIVWMLIKTVRAFVMNKKTKAKYKEETLEVAQERLKQAYITEAKQWPRIFTNLIYIWYFIYMLVMILFY